MNRYAAVLAVATVLVVGTVLPASPASAASSWSTSIPDLADGTYDCTGSRLDRNGLSQIQDCTRAVAGGFWQTVTIFYDGSTHDATVDLVIDALRNSVTVGSVECSGTIPHGRQRACWGSTTQAPSSSVRAYDRGDSNVGDINGRYSGTFDGGKVLYVLVPPAYSSPHLVPK